MTSCGAVDTIGDALFVPQMSRATADAMDEVTTSRHAFDTIGGVSLVPKKSQTTSAQFPVSPKNTLEAFLVALPKVRSALVRLPLLA